MVKRAHCLMRSRFVVSIPSLSLPPLHACLIIIIHKSHKSLSGHSISMYTSKLCTRTRALTLVCNTFMYVAFLKSRDQHSIWIPYVGTIQSTLQGQGYTQNCRFWLPVSKSRFTKSSFHNYIYCIKPNHEKCETVRSSMVFVIGFLVFSAQKGMSHALRNWPW